MNRESWSHLAPEAIGFDAALVGVLDAFRPLPLESVPLSEALGRTLGEDVIARSDSPPFTNAAMDGFACRASDLTSATERRPVTLPVRETVNAGEAGASIIAPGTAIRIMTGAPLPAGADVVAPFESVEEVGDRPGREIRLRHPLSTWANVRFAGEDVRRGAAALRKGTRLRPAELALAAAMGWPALRVHVQPRVALLATGDELIPPGDELRPGQLWDSNSAAISAMIQQAGGLPLPLGIASDDQRGLREKLAAAAQAGTDLLITSGGVAAGDRDFVTGLLQAEGRIAFRQVRIKPGQPLVFGEFDDLKVLGLPGNPVAVAVTFLQFARPAMMKMLGRTALYLPRVAARMLDPVDNRGGRRLFVRVRVERTAEGYAARLAGPQGAALLSTLVNANGLLVVPETCERVEPGDILPVELIDGE